MSNNIGMNIKLVFTILIFSSYASANIGGSDLQNFNPTTNGLGFLSVHSSQTLEPGQFNLGSFLNFTTNSLAYATITAAPNNQTFAEPNDKLLYSNLHFGVGLMQGWDLGVSAGFINSQTIEKDNFLFAYGDTGVNDIRINTKVRLLAEESFGIAALATIDFDQIKNNPFVGNNPGPTINLEAAFDYQLSPHILWAVNLGYRLRQPGSTIPNKGVIPLPDQWLYSTSLSYDTDDNGSALLAELYGSYPTEITTTPTDRQLSNLELLLGYRWSGLENLDLHGGFGTEAYHGLGSPDFRVYLGLNWRINFLEKDIPPRNTYQDAPAGDQDQDGVPDPIDQCANTADNQTVDDRGCTPVTSQEITTPQIDSDQDGVMDSDDQCPQTAPSTRVNNFGCAIENY